MSWQLYGNTKVLQRHLVQSLLIAIPYQSVTKPFKRLYQCNLWPSVKEKRKIIHFSLNLLHVPTFKCPPPSEVNYPFFTYTQIIICQDCNLWLYGNENQRSFKNKLIYNTKTLNTFMIFKYIYLFITVRCYFKLSLWTDIEESSLPLFIEESSLPLFQRKRWLILLRFRSLDGVSRLERKSFIKHMTHWKVYTSDFSPLRGGIWVV